jgi:hypothetical protein
MNGDAREAESWSRDLPFSSCVLGKEPRSLEGDGREAETRGREADFSSRGMGNRSRAMNQGRRGHRHRSMRRATLVSG